jgi:choline-sulfatase
LPEPIPGSRARRARLSRPNVLIILSDQHSRHHLGCYGDELVRTPRLDALAAGGMRMDAAYTAAPVCVPSRMSFMTSRTPSQNEVWTNHDILSSALPTWAHAMGAGGYETALVGRMHFVGADQRHGFERRPVGEYSAVHPGARRQGSPQFVQIPSSTSGQTRECVEIAGRGRTSYQAFDETVTEGALRYLEEKAAGGDGTGRDERPFAAVVGYVLPHCPFVAPQELFDYYYERVDVPYQPEAHEQPPAVVNFRRRRGLLDPPLPEERIRVARAAYFGLCEYLDGLIGQVLDKLEETGLAENTLVVYASDHGEMAGEHGCWWKSNYYEGSVGVPMIARLPGTIPAGSTSDDICSLMDLGPTMTELGQAPAQPRADGTSLWRVWQGEDDPRRPRETVSELGPTKTDAPSRMIRRGRWKLTKYADDTPPMLFDLRQDPDELHDRAGDPSLADLQQDLLRALYDGWDPTHVRRVCQRHAEDMQLLSAWGAAVQPLHEDSLPVPEGVEQVERR